MVFLQALQEKAFPMKLVILCSLLLLSSLVFPKDEERKRSRTDCKFVCSHSWAPLFCCGKRNSFLFLPIYFHFHSLFCNHSLKSLAGSKTSSVSVNVRARLLSLDWKIHLLLRAKEWDFSIMRRESTGWQMWHTGVISIQEQQNCRPMYLVMGQTAAHSHFDL